MARRHPRRAGVTSGCDRARVPSPTNAGPDAPVSAAERPEASVGWALPCLVAVMDAAWITPYALLAGTIWFSPGIGLLNPVAILVLLAGTQVLTRRFLATTDERRARAALAALGVLVTAGVVAWQYGDTAWWRLQGPLWRTATSVLTGSRPVAPAWILAMLVWRRGLVIGRTALEYYDVEAVFNLGLGALGVFAALMAVGSSVLVLAATATAVFPYLLLFFAASLLALPLARLHSVQRLTRASVRHTRVSGGWYGLLAGAVIVLLGIATLAGVMLRLDVNALLHAAGAAVDVLLIIILYAIALPIGVILSGVIWVIRLLLHPGTKPSLSPLSAPVWIQQVASHQTTGLPPDAAMALRWGVAVILLILGALWLARSVFRYGRAGRHIPADESRESVWSWADLRASWRTLFQPRRRGRRASLPADYGTGTVGTIRRFYAEFLTLAAALGNPRHKSQTPAELAGVVRAAHPGVAAAVDTLTAMYSRARYGLAALSLEDVEVARAALEQMRVERSTGPDDQPPRRRMGEDG